MTECVRSNQGSFCQEMWILPHRMVVIGSPQSPAIMTATSTTQPQISTNQPPFGPSNFFGGVIAVKTKTKRTPGENTCQLLHHLCLQHSFPALGSYSLHGWKICNLSSFIVLNNIESARHFHLQTRQFLPAPVMRQHLQHPWRGSFVISAKLGSQNGERES